MEVGHARWTSGRGRTVGGHADRRTEEGRGVNGRTGGWTNMLADGRTGGRAGRGGRWRMDF